MLKTDKQNSGRRKMRLVKHFNLHKEWNNIRDEIKVKEHFLLLLIYLKDKFCLG